MQIFSLNAGDTIKPITFQSSGGTVTGSATYDGAFIVAWLGMKGTPSVLPAVPDITYSWQAGTPGSSMPGLMNAHFANDLNFLAQRPYLMAYQTSAQTGIAMNSPANLNLQSITGIIHGDNGDNYSGWNGTSDAYVAQKSGWYLCVQETFMATPTLTVHPAHYAGFAPSVAGANGPDFFQQANAITRTNGGGAAAVGMYYLRAGDFNFTIRPGDRHVKHHHVNMGGVRPQHPL